MVNPLPNDRIPEPKNRRNTVADMSLPNSPTVTHTNNMEEMQYQADGHPKGIASFTKGLNHNNMGEVLIPADFDQFLNAIQDSLTDVPNYSNSLSLFENLPIGSGIAADKPKAKLVNPVCGLSYDSEGLDAFNRNIPPAPRMDSLNGAAEIAELYWMYLMRDINFTDYNEENIAEDAVGDLKNNFGAYDFTIGSLHTSWTKTGITLSSKTLFRGINVGDNVGPYISQFMLRGNIDKPLKRNEKHGYVKFGTTSIDQKHVVAKKELDFIEEKLAETLDINLEQAEQELAFEQMMETLNELISTKKVWMQADPSSTGLSLSSNKGELIGYYDTIAEDSSGKKYPHVVLGRAYDAVQNASQEKINHTKSGIKDQLYDNGWILDKKDLRRRFNGHSSRVVRFYPEKFNPISFTEHELTEMGVEIKESDNGKDS